MPRGRWLQRSASSIAFERQGLLNEPIRVVFISRVHVAKMTPRQPFRLPGYPAVWIGQVMRRAFFSIAPRCIASDEKVALVQARVTLKA